MVLPDDDEILSLNEHDGCHDFVDELQGGFVIAGPDEVELDGVFGPHPGIGGPGTVFIKAPGVLHLGLVDDDRPYSSSSPVSTIKELLPPA